MLEYDSLLNVMVAMKATDKFVNEINASLNNPLGRMKVWTSINSQSGMD